MLNRVALLILGAVRVYDSVAAPAMNNRENMVEKMMIYCGMPVVEIKVTVVVEEVVDLWQRCCG